MAGPWTVSRYLVELPGAILLLANDPAPQGCLIPATKVSLEIIDRYKDADAQTNGSYLKKSATGNERVSGLFARKGSTQFQQSLPGNDYGDGYVPMTQQPYVLDDWNEWMLLNSAPLK